MRSYYRTVVESHRRAPYRTFVLRANVTDHSRNYPRDICQSTSSPTAPKKVYNPLLPSRSGIDVPPSSRASTLNYSGRKRRSLQSLNCIARAGTGTSRQSLTWSRSKRLRIVQSLSERRSLRHRLVLPANYILFLIFGLHIQYSN